MANGTSALRVVEAPRSVDTVDLLRFCVANRDDTVAWSEFLRRILPRLRHFVMAAFYTSLGNTCFSRARILSSIFQESDLVQITIVRLVERDCALLKRFSGKTEDDLLVYLAVISRSAVRDTLRRERALKRGMVRPRTPDQNGHERVLALSPHRYDEPGIERALLTREMAELGERMLASLSGPSSIRDRLIFQLYFCHDLSLDEIARCGGINLSKAGVKKVLSRLKKQLRTLVSGGMTDAAA